MKMCVHQTKKNKNNKIFKKYLLMNGKTDRHVKSKKYIVPYIKRIREKPKTKQDPTQFYFNLTNTVSAIM